MVKNEIMNINDSLSMEIAMGGPFKIKLSDILFFEAMLGALQSY